MEILEFCIQKLQSAEIDKFELFFEKSSNLSLDIKDGKLDHLTRATNQGLSIRVLKNQKMGFSYTFDLSPKAVEAAIRTAADIAHLMPADPFNDLCAISHNKGGFSSVLYPEVENHDARGLDVPLEQKIELARSMEETARKQDSRIKRVRKASFNESRDEVIMVDTMGEQIRHLSTLFGASLMCVAEDGKDAETGFDSQYTNFYDQLSGNDVAVQAAQDAVSLLHAKAGPTIVCPAVFKNSVVADLIGFLSGSFSAENIDKNFSLLIGKKGEKMFSDKFTLVDDALLAGGVGSSPFDGEGTPSQTTKLVENGLVLNFLYDGYYARKHSVSNTASSRRGSLKAPPGVGSSNLFLAKGKKSLTQLLADAKQGVYITDLMGLHTANPITGDFSVGASGILIENGKLTQPIKGFAVAGNLVELLSHVVDVGSDLRFWGSIGAPSLFISKLSVSGN